VQLDKNRVEKEFTIGLTARGR